MEPPPPVESAPPAESAPPKAIEITPADPVRQETTSLDTVVGMFLKTIANKDKAIAAAHAEVVSTKDQMIALLRERNGV